MTNRQLAVAMFQHSKDTKVNQHQVTWDDFATQLTKFVELDAHGLDEAGLKRLKDTQKMWSPVHYRLGTTRGNGGVAHLECLVLDLDNQAWEPVKQVLEPYEYVIHTTFSHSDTNPRYRVVLPLSEPIPADRWAETWQVCQRHFSGVNDPSVSDLARTYFVPCFRTGFDYFSDRHAGKWLNPAELRATTPPARQTSDDADFPVDAPLNTLDAIHDRWLKHRNRKGLRHKTLLQCLTALIRLALNGVDIKQTNRWLRNQFVAAVTVDRGKAVAEAEFHEALVDALLHVVKDTKLDDNPAKLSVVDRLLTVAEAHFDFVATDDGQLFAVRKGSSIAEPLYDDFPETLAALHRQQTGRAPKQAALNDSVTVLAGNAKQRERVTVNLRVARQPGTALLDLGDLNGTVVEVKPNSWKLLNRSPVLFQRNAATLALPEPTTPDFDKLRPLVNVDDDDYQLTKVWLVHALLKLPTPIYFPESPYGYGKTSLARLLKSLVDPSRADVTSPPRDSGEWVVTVTNQYVVVVDDLNKVSEWFVGDLKRTVTGAAVLKRNLYTNNDASVYNFQNPLIITSVELSRLPADLIQRTLPVTLLPISDDQRRTEQDLSDYLETHKAAILAGLLEQTARVLAVLDDRDEPLDRMADFSKTCAAFDKVNGTATLAHYRRIVSAAQTNLVRGSELGRVLLEFLEAEVVGTLSLTSRELLTKLQQHVIRAQLVTTQEFPQTAEKLSAELSRFVPALALAGFEAKRPPRTSTARSWHFTRIPRDGMTVVTVSPHFSPLTLEGIESHTDQPESETL